MILQVTPIVAIAPLIIIWVNDVKLSLLICAWIVAFFPILSNTDDRAELGRPQPASTCSSSTGRRRWQTCCTSAAGGDAVLPGRPAASRAACALIGAVVAEFVAGTGGRVGLAYRILESGYQLRIPRMFAALLLISASGIVLFLALSLLSHLCLRRWHESAFDREG